mgnify:CR=1 FL=1
MTAPKLTSRKIGFAAANESITPESSGRGSRTNSGSESSGDELPAMAVREASDSSMWP